MVLPVEDEEGFFSYSYFVLLLRTRISYSKTALPIEYEVRGGGTITRRR